MSLIESKIYSYCSIIIYDYLYDCYDVCMYLCVGVCLWHWIWQKYIIIMIGVNKKGNLQSFTYPIKQWFFFHIFCLIELFFYIFYIFEFLNGKFFISFFSSIILTIVFKSQWKKWIACENILRPLFFDGRIRWLQYIWTNLKFFPFCSQSFNVTGICICHYLFVFLYFKNTCFAVLREKLLFVLVCMLLLHFFEWKNWKKICLHNKTRMWNFLTEFCLCSFF